jgi:molybdenum cofactor cytidylyltransferase
MTRAAGPIGPIGAVVLAAGGSTRMGRPKQLLVYEGETLLRRAARLARAAVDGPVVVVLGAEAESFGQLSADSSTVLLVHEGWRQGMGSSLAVGTRRLSELAPNLSGALLLLIDQPLIALPYPASLVAHFRSTDVDLAATRYGWAEGSAVGPPAVFAQHLFPRLMALRGDQGARSLLNDPSLRRAFLTHEPAAIDWDTPEDVLQ